MEYKISMRVEGHVTVTVDAKTPEEAFAKANGELEKNGFDLNDICVEETEFLDCEDADGNITAY